MRVVVFLGPSLPLADARAVLPDALYLPPAAQADLVSAVGIRRAQIIGLVDGTFRHNLSVWHSEILYALNSGVKVFGASSMGALRAAETYAYGTIGVGRIFEWYARGHITRDDEVAVVHADEKEGYISLSEPLVNIRATMEHAVSRGVLSSHVADAVIGVTAELFYPERTITRILQACAEAGIGTGALRVVESCLHNDYVDQKRLDAAALLERIANEIKLDSSRQVNFEFARPYVFETLYNLDRRVSRSEREVPLQSIAEHVALHAEDFPKILDAALHRGLLIYMGALLGITVEDDEIIAEETRFREARGISDDEDCVSWLARMDLNDAEFKRLVREECVLRRLRTWLLGNRGLDRAVRYILDELRVRGQYPDWADAASIEYACAEAHERSPQYDRVWPADGDWLAARHSERTGKEIGSLSAFAAECGFEDAEGVRTALVRAFIHRDVVDRATNVLQRIDDLDDVVQR